MKKTIKGWGIVSKRGKTLFSMADKYEVIKRKKKPYVNENFKVVPLTITYTV